MGQSGMKFWATTVVLLLFASAASGQLRTIPDQARRGQMSHLQDMVVEIDGKPVRLSPGAQIRDPDNRLVLPVSLPANSDVRYVADESGALLAGDISNTNVFVADDQSRRTVRAMFEEQVGWAVEAGVDFVIAETFSWGEEALIALDRVVTNMVFVDTEAMGLRAAEVLDRLAAAGVGAVPVPGGVRMVTHVDVDDDGIATAIDAWRTIAADAAKEAS